MVLGVKLIYFHMEFLKMLFTLKTALQFKGKNQGQVISAQSSRASHNCKTKVKMERIAFTALCKQMIG